MIHLSPLQRAMLEAVRAAPDPLTLPELATIVGSTRKSVNVRVRQMRAAGCDRIETVNCGYHDKRYRWRA